MSEKKETAQTIELDEAVVKAIADKMALSVEKSVAKQVEDAVAKAEEAKVKALEKTEKTIKKDVSGGDFAKDVNVISGKSAVEKEPIHQRIAKAYRALVSFDGATLKKYNDVALKNIQKAGYANTAVNADGGYIVADPEFEAAIEKLEPIYGIASREATVRRITSNSVKTNKQGTGVSMYDTAEAGAKTGTKMTIEQQEVSLRKFAAIAPVTDELTDDAAIDFYNELTEGFAQERARWMDKLVFTENGTTSAKKGILRASGTKAEPLSGAISTITWDDVLNAWYKLPTASQANAKLYIHPTVYNVLRQVKDDNGRYQLSIDNGLAGLRGIPVVLADIMPSVTDVDSDGSTPYAVVADLKKSTRLYMKKGLVMTVLREGTIADADGSDVKLAQQDMTALRAVTRMVQLHKFPEAACVIGTGNVS